MFKDISKSVFPSLLKELADSSFSRSIAVSGFEACGIYPINRTKITKEKLRLGNLFGIDAVDDETSETSSDEGDESDGSLIDLDMENREAGEERLIDEQTSKLGANNYNLIIKNSC